MPPRFRTSIVVAFALVFFYFIFPFSTNEDSHVVEILPGAGSAAGKHGTGGQSNLLHDEGQPNLLIALTKELPKPTPSIDSWPLSSSIASAKPAATKAAEPSDVITQEQFFKESDELGQERSANKIFGTSLKDLIGVGNHAGFANAMLTPTESWTSYNDEPPYTYNPYPDYNDKAWNSTNKGTYVPCDGPDGEVREVLVFSGRPKGFENPPIGSYVPLGIDSNLCFERESRLGAYGYTEGEAAQIPAHAKRVPKKIDWDSVNWGRLQEYCVARNADRYVQLEQKLPIKDDITVSKSNPPQSASGSLKARGAEGQNGTVPISNGTITDEAEARKQGLHGLPQNDIKPKSRTAVLVRSWSRRNYTENDKQNIRALVTELSLRSGGEYQVYLLVGVEEDLPIWTNATVHQQVIQDNVPKEFWNMTVLWDEKINKELYPKAQALVGNVNKSQWQPLQNFALENPEFEFFWNWELDTRYTGHHYNLLERLAIFAKKQPRKGLWERNERFYIPSLHADYYDSKFRKTVEAASGSEVVWGAVSIEGVKPVGPKPPLPSFKEDNYKWGVGDEADYISLAPIFNPVGTTWPDKDDVFGYKGTRETPRRASIGTQARVSRTLLEAMHQENKNGNFLGAEMAPQTVSLLHGLKAVYAPIPIFFDRQWSGKKLDKWFNPGPKGVSGSTEESPFSKAREGRFAGSTWFVQANAPTRLYNNWLGWEYGGTGGTEWEKSHGRACLPPMLLQPIKDVAMPPPEH
ncbi:hypothetical protein B0O99DRAFT_562364 [Bisporella sp. PMI_857]|nr:hypothetical protein B0O99DRAFT_562364 [Bisporella sp. PMI_857]